MEKEIQFHGGTSFKDYLKGEDLMNRPWYKNYPYKEDVQIPEESLYILLDKTVRLYGDQPAVIFEDKIVTYIELKDQVDRLASAWKELGYQKGERIGLMLSNHPDYIISYYAALSLGLIIVQVNPMYTPRELLQILYDSKLTYLVTDPPALETVRKVYDNYRFRHIMLSQMTVDHQEDDIFQNLDELKGHSKTFEKPVSISVHDDVAIIQYTGGTTGKMKGAMLTHYNLMANVIQSYAAYKGKLQLGQEVVLAATPLYHVYAMTSAMNFGIFIGGTILLIRKFDIDYVLESIKKYRPTFFPGVPKMYNAFINHPQVESYGLDCIKVCSSGSAPLPVDVIKRFEYLTNAVISEGYGLSETSPTTHRNPTNGTRKVGSIGIPVPFTDCLIVDDYGQELPPMAIGELLIRGPQVMKGYWGNKDETNKALQNDWLYTGDLAMMDQDGYFFIVGRKKEMIIVGGFNIYPQEVEGVLYEHPNIKEVAVAGIPNEVEGEIVKAYIVPKDGCQVDLEEVRGYCYQKLTRYKVPKEFEIRDSLPRNTVGKLLKRILIQEEKEKDSITTSSH